MTKYWLFAILFLTLASCKEDKVAVPWECSPCGEYTGIFNGNIASAIAPNIDTSFVNLPTTIYISENSDETIDITVDVTSVFAPYDSIFFKFDNSLWVDLSLTGEYYPPYAGQAEVFFSLQAICENDYQDLQGNITISGDASGILTFALSK